MNSLNLKQIDGGNIIKQADFGSNLSFELLDERRRKIPELDGQTATIRLIKGDNIAYQTESLIVDSAVSFKFDRVLEKGIYVLEIVAGNYVFPSNNMVKITIEKTAGNYKPENMVKTDLVELQGKITAIEQREHDVNQELLDVGQKQAEMTKRIEILEQKEDHDTIYNDTEIKQSVADVDTKVDNLSEKVTALEERPIVDTALTERIEALEQKPDNDTVYNDAEIKQSVADVDTKVDNLSEKVTALEERPIVDTALTERVEALEQKPDKDTVYDDTAIKKELSELNESIAKKKLYFAYANDSGNGVGFTKLDAPDSISNLLYQYFGISEKDSDNYEDYFWVPTQAMVIIELSSIKTEIDKLKKLHEVKRAPTGYTLDRTTTPWTVWFDNGCGMTIPEYGTTASIYGYGQGQNAYDNNFRSFPLPPTIMSVSHGTLTIEKIKTIEGSCDFWASGITIINPIRDRNDYDWTNARFNKASLDYAGDPYYSYKYVRQQYFIRTMYELGIWSKSDVEGFGAVKK